MRLYIGAMLLVALVGLCLIQANVVAKSSTPIKIDARSIQENGSPSSSSTLLLGPARTGISSRARSMDYEMDSQDGFRFVIPKLAKSPSKNGTSNLNSPLKNSSRNSSMGKSIRPQAGKTSPKIPASTSRNNSGKPTIGSPKATGSKNSDKLKQLLRALCDAQKSKKLRQPMMTAVGQ